MMTPSALNGLPVSAAIPSQPHRAAKRALIAGAIVGGVKAVTHHWHGYQCGAQTLPTAALSVAKATATAGFLSGATVAVADAVKDQPTKALLSVIGVAAVSLYLLDAIRGKPNEKK